MIDKMDLARHTLASEDFDKVKRKPSSLQKVNIGFGAKYMLGRLQKEILVTQFHFVYF